MDEIEWQLATDPTNVIIHVPTWSFFEVVGEEARLIRTNEIGTPSEEQLSVLAMEAVEQYHSGLVSIHPPAEDDEPERSHRRCFHYRGLSM